MPTQTLQLGHSPDPDDAFMFYALAQDSPLVPTGNWRFQHVLQDIQTLNQRARTGDLEITAISIHAYPYVADRYALTSCGSSMGDQYGPLVVARDPMTDHTGGVQLDHLRGKTIAIPGELTTAFLTLQLLLGKASKNGDVSCSKEINSSRPYLSPSHSREINSSRPYLFPEPSLSIQPSSFNYVVVPFDQILQFVRNGHADAGLVIHEGQLTYKTMGLSLIVDLGVWWFEQTGLPLPLGGNCIRKDLGPAAMREITDILKSSIQYSLDHRDRSVEYALQFGRDLDRDLADRFVGMYVNHWTLDYGDQGKEAITRLLAEGAKMGIVPPIDGIEFVQAR